MVLNRIQLLIIFVLCDVFVTFLSLGFFSPELKISYRASPQNETHVNEYTFSRSPFDFVVLLFIRLILLISAALLIALHRDKFIKAMDLLIRGFSIATVSYSFVKLLAFSENEELLYYPGLWFILSWTWLVSPLFGVFWHRSLSSSPLNYSRVSKSDEEKPDKSVAVTEEKSPSTEESNPSKGTTWMHIKQLLSYCLPFWKWFFGGFFFLVSYSSVRISIPLFMGRVVGSTMGGLGDGNPFESVVIVAVLSIASGILGGLRGGCFDYGCSLVCQKMRKDLFGSFVKQEIDFYDSTKSGELVSRLTSDCEAVSSGMASNFNIFTRNAIMLMGSLFFMFSLSWRLTIVSFIILPLYVYILKVFGTIYDELSKNLQKTNANANQTAEEVLSTMRTVRSFAGEKREANRFNKSSDETLAVGKKRAIATLGDSGLGELNCNVALVGCLAYGCRLAMTGKLSSEDFIAFLFYQIQLGENLMYIQEVVNGIMTAVGASRKVFEYINRVPKMPFDGRCKDDIKGEFKFDAVSLTYSGRPNDPVLKGLNLHIKAGETVALVGPSGGGKSSIVSLVEHFYEPTKGEITLDGIPIRDYDHSYYHQKVALVGQEPVLYDGTIRENIAYGCDWATEDDIVKAAKIADAHGFVTAQEKGYDTQCGEKGLQLSGGQKQRVAIARAVVRNPSVLILDEATSALDGESEHAVQKAIDGASAGRTVIIIAHRLSAVKNADRIVVLEKGTIVQEGTHPELMEDASGLYHHLMSRQIQ